MTWEIVRFPDGKVMLSVTGDEFLGILPPEVDELIEEHNDSIVDGSYNERIDIERHFSKTSLFTFKLSPSNIKIKEAVDNVNRQTQAEIDADNAAAESDAQQQAAAQANVEAAAR